MTSSPSVQGESLDAVSRDGCDDLVPADVDDDLGHHGADGHSLYDTRELVTRRELDLAPRS